MKADVNKAHTSSLTPLIFAFFSGHVEIVKLLLAAGAQKDKIDDGGKTALTYTAERERSTRGRPATPAGSVGRVST